MSPASIPAEPLGIRWRAEGARHAWGPLEQAARQAVAASPETPGAWIGLAQVLRHQGKAEEAVAALRTAAERIPAHAAIRLALAEALSVVGAVAEALEQTQAALRTEGRSREALKLRLKLLLATGGWQAAAPAAEAMIEADAGSPLLLDWWAARSRSGTAGDEDLLSGAEAVLARRPGNTAALYYKALALARLGQAEAAREVISTRAMAKLGTIEVPAAFASRAAFHAALQGEILNDPTLQQEPAGKATRHGRQTRQLQPGLGPATAGLLESLHAAAAAGAGALAARCPSFAAAQPQEAALRVWAVVCGPDGFQLSHWHSDAWASGVYYVSSASDGTDGRYPGPLLLGAMNPSELDLPPWEVLEVDPEPGRLVVFPSWLPHATRASAAEGLRISVAFDVVPQSGI